MKKSKEYNYIKDGKNKLFYNTSLVFNNFNMDDRTKEDLKREIYNKINVVNQFAMIDFNDVEYRHVYIELDSTTYKIWNSKDDIEYYVIEVTGVRYSKHELNSYYDEPIDYGEIGHFRTDIFSRIYDVKITY